MTELSSRCNFIPLFGSYTFSFLIKFNRKTMFHAFELNFRIIGKVMVSKKNHNVTIDYQTDQDPRIEENFTNFNRTKRSLRLKTLGNY